MSASGYSAGREAAAIEWQRTRALIQFLLLRIADTQAMTTSRPMSPAVRHNLRERAAADRRVIKAAQEYSPELAEGDNGEWAFGEVLRILASAYADHPDYDESWRP